MLLKVNKLTQKLRDIAQDHIWLHIRQSERDYYMFVLLALFLRGLIQISALDK